jgi:DNA polymerase-4
MAGDNEKVRRVFAWVRVYDLAAAVEARSRSGGPREDRPVVLYDEAGQRVVSASPGARQHGMRPGMTRWEAEQRCPDLIAAPADREKYDYFWQRVVEVCGDYSPEVGVGRGAENGEILRCAQDDNSCMIRLDLTGSERLFGPPGEVAREIRNRLRAEVGATASVGIGSNPTVARLACELAKPGEVVEVAPEEAAAFVGRAPVAMLPGVDLEMAQRLAEMGIRKAKELAELPAEAVARAFGEEGRRAWEAARGEATQGVGQDPASAVGGLRMTGAADGGPRMTAPGVAFITAEVDLRPATEERERIRAGLRVAADEVARKLRERGEVAQQVGVELVFRELRKVGMRRTLRHATRSPEVIFQTTRGLLARVKLGERLVRRVRVKVARLSPGPQGGQMSLPLLEPEARRERLSEMVDRVKDRFGEGAVVRGSARELVRW